MGADSIGIVTHETPPASDIDSSRGPLGPSDGSLLVARKRSV